MRLCFCDAIPCIRNRTDVLILQHIGERSHPFNTARIVQQSLHRCRVIVDHNQQFGTRHLPIQKGAGLLYLTDNAPKLTELAESDRPRQLVIVDGTWHQAKTIVRDVPQLRSLPCFRLAPDAPGQYRIRREPSAQSLSTLEAIVAALQVLEPNTPGLDRLLCAFHQMVNDQLANSAGQMAWRRQKKSQRPRYLPHAMMQNTQGLVVAYGEAAPRQPGQPKSIASWPVSWFARRLSSNEEFSCLLKQPQPLSATALRHMRLSNADFDVAISPDEFRSRWRQFLRRNDVLVVYHPRTYRLLTRIEADQPRCLVLKSICRNWRSDFRSLEELLAKEGLCVPGPEHQTRTQQRLEMAVELVNHIHRH